jgi:hypothetical protein
MRAFSLASSGAAPTAASPSAALQEAQYQQFVASFNAIAARPRQPPGFQSLPAFKAPSSAEQDACYEQFLFSAAASANAPQQQPMHSARATAPQRAVGVVQPVKPARVVEANLLREIIDEVHVVSWVWAWVIGFGLGLLGLGLGYWVWVWVIGSGFGFLGSGLGYWVSRVSSREPLSLSSSYFVVIRALR